MAAFCNGTAFEFSVQRVCMRAINFNFFGYDEGGWLVINAADVLFSAGLLKHELVARGGYYG